MKKNRINESDHKIKNIKQFSIILEKQWLF